MARSDFVLLRCRVHAVGNMAATGRHAVILSTHMVEAVGAFCTDVIFMAEGRLAHRWTTADLRAARAGEGGFEAAVMSRIMDAAAIGAEARS